MTPTSALTLRVISAADHLEYVKARGASGAVSFLQLPSWGGVKAEWRHESLGWFDGDQIIGAALVLLRKVPRINRFLPTYQKVQILTGRASTADSVWRTG